MKKLVSLLLAAAMMTTLMTGCSSSGSSSAPSGSGAGSSAASSSAAEAPEATVLKVDVANVTVEGSVQDQACRKLVELLNESGLFEATFYPNSQLGSAIDNYESIHAGDFLITTGGGSDWGDVCGVPDMGCAMTPFLYDELSDVYGLAESDLWKGMLAEAETNGMKIFASPAMSGARYFMTNKEIHTPEDLAGVKLRVPTSSYYINAIEAFGGTPTAIPVNELYTSLAQKMVDGCEFPYEDAYGRQLYEVVEYASTTPYLIGFVFFGTSDDLWNAMNDEQKAVMEAAAAEAGAYSIEIFSEMEAKGKQQLEDAGMTFVDIDVESFRACLDKFYELCGWDDAFVAELTKVMEDYRASK